MPTDSRPRKCQRGRSRKLRRNDDVAATGRATIRRLVEELPEPYREAIVLREINDLSYKEIAEIAGVPVGTVTSRLARARAMLRSAWNAAETTARPGSATATSSAMNCAEFEVADPRRARRWARRRGGGACSGLFGLRREARFISRHARGHGRRCAEGGRTDVSRAIGSKRRFQTPGIDLSLRARAWPRLAAWGTGAKSGNAAVGF